MEVKKDGNCCFCGEKYLHYGNSTWPVNEGSEGEHKRACDRCNFTVVLAARAPQLKDYFTEENYEKEIKARVNF